MSLSSLVLIELFYDLMKRSEMECHDVRFPAKPGRKWAVK